MQEKVRYLPPHRREGGTLENVAREMPKVAKTTTPYRIFAQTNPITQPGVYKGGFSFNGGPWGFMGNHAVTYMSKWQLGTTSTISSLRSSTSSSSSSTSTTSFPVG